MPENRRRARSAYEDALDRNPEDWNAHYRLGQIALADGDLGEAIDSFEKAARLNPGAAEVWYELGKAQYRDRRFDDARESFEKVSQLKPNLQGNWFNLGLSNLALRRISEATRAFTESVKAGLIMRRATTNWEKSIWLRETGRLLQTLSPWQPILHPGSPSTGKVLVPLTSRRGLPGLQASL